MDYFLLIAGFVILLYSGSFLVKGGVELAHHFKLSKLVIGIVIVSLGTSAPELFVSIGAALNNSPDISVGNVVGSNIANIGLVLGITAMIIPVPVHKNVVIKDWPVLLIASLVLLLFSIDKTLGVLEGIMFLILLAVYIYWSIISSHRNYKNNPEEIEESKFSVRTAFAMVILASAGLYLGAGLLVGSAKNIALEFGVSERVIGLTLVAFGTSVPELATSIVAAVKKQMDISVGNIVGSNIFNILAVLGVTSIIKTIKVGSEIVNFDIYCMIAMVALLLLVILPSKKSIVKRFEGVILFGAYLLYIYLVFTK